MVSNLLISIVRIMHEIRQKCKMFSVTVLQKSVEMVKRLEGEWPFLVSGSLSFIQVILPTPGCKYPYMSGSANG